MLTKERKLRIMNLLEERSFVTIKELIEDFNVSRSSIVRDLIELENQGLIQRERGGASLKSVDITLTSFNEPAVQEKENLHIVQKQRICKEAAKSIRDGDCVYIDSGTTPVYLLDYLQDKKITLVTPSTFLIRKLSANFKGDIYLLGGQFNKSYDMSYGSLTLEMIRQFYFDHAFLSTNGVDLETKEVYVFDFKAGAVKKEIMSRCKRTDLLIDASKFETRAMCTWANLDDFHTVYTDSIKDGIEPLENFVICEKE